jgi:hypothetical protein
MSKVAIKIFIALVLVAAIVVLVHRVRAQSSMVPTMTNGTTPGDQAGSNVSVSGTWPTQTITSGQPAVLIGATSSIGGSLLLAGSCATGTVTIAGATTSMTAVASPVTTLANGIQWQAAVTSANTVTVYECALAALTPSSSVFNVRVIP